MFLRTIFFFCLVTLGMPAQRVNSTSPGAESFQIAGSVIDAATSQPLADARVAIAPVSKRDAYTVALTGADGRFTFSNLSPGKYTLVGWLDEPPCDVYDPAGLDGCRTTGMALTVDANSQQSVALNVKALRNQ